jgi:Na+/proline symporter
MVEQKYATGFAMEFWWSLTLPTTMFLSLTGFCAYRFRETKSLSIGQFLEMRYSRKLRIFASALRSTSEVLANMIMPAVAGRFFIYYFGLPQYFTVFGVEIPTFNALIILCLTMAIGIICMGGTLALVITDSIQGMFCYPIMAVFVGFVLYKFSWSDHIIPVLTDRVAKQSFLDPYDISELRDFNLFMVGVTLVTTVVNRGAWIGAGNTTSAKSPHEQKMAAMLGTAIALKESGVMEHLDGDVIFLAVPAEEFIDLLNKLICISTVNCTSVCNGFTTGSRASKAMHTYLKKELCCFRIKIKNITDNSFSSYFHTYISYLKSI